MCACRPQRRHISFCAQSVCAQSVVKTDADQRARVVTSHLLPTYARVNLAFERGEGAWLIATNGDRSLDFTSRVAVNALGHAHPRLVAAVSEQAQKLCQVSNLYQIPEAERVAARLCGR